MVLLVFLVIITFAVYFIMSAKDRFTGDIRSSLTKVKNMKGGFTRFAGKQLAVVSALILLLLSLGYFIRAWNVVYSPTGVVYGAGFTDVHVNLIFFRVISVVAIIAAAVIATIIQIFFLIICKYSRSSISYLLLLWEP
jgi:uncharacterized membrane protein (UPF0182 family)